MSENHEVLYAADVARIRGTSVRAARAWLAALESEHGSNVVWRVGEKLSMTRRAFDRLLPNVRGASEASLKQLQKQVHAQAHAIFDLREAVSELQGRMTPA
jgi:hypothetical protein